MARMFLRGTIGKDRPCNVFASYVSGKEVAWARQRRHHRTASSTVCGKSIAVRRRSRDRYALKGSPTASIPLPFIHSTPQGDAMNKLRLKLEDLQIDSFSTTPVKKEKGT
ncbi:MAG TPA: hypothetical protein VFS20_13660, partial [Longimicrobium sp.]|nr:hypothetical protein [Longimicrobium sp.]